MHLKIYMLATVFLLACLPLDAQVSPDCATAIPICSNTPVTGGVEGYGLDDFDDADRTGCLEPSLSGYIESNSAWYRFRTGASGQLGFNIGFDPAEDWDYALYRASDCGELGEPVRCDFFDNQDGKSYMGVGEDPTGDTGSELYSPWLQVAAGEDYYLMINNFSNTNSGFSIQFSGELFRQHPDDALDCSIIDNLLGPPVAACEGDPVELNAHTDGATAYEWYRDSGSGFERIPGQADPTYQATAPALYRVRVLLADGSQLLSEVQVAFSPAAVAYEIADRTLCTEGAFDLHSLDAEALGAQSPEIFRVSYHLSEEEARQGRNPLPPQWSPEGQAGTVFYRVTSIQNPNCYDATKSFDYNLLAPPELQLPEQAFLCASLDPPVLGPLIPEAGVSYLWSTGDQNPRISPTLPGLYTLTAVRESGGVQCQTIDTVEVIASVPPQIGQVVVEDLRGSNRVVVEPLEPGSFEYALGDGPYQSSPVFNGVPAGTHELQMRDTRGCGSVSETIVVVGFSSFFTPNGDGRHDRWEMNGLGALSDPVVFIFDRYGKLLKQLDESSPGWDGTFNGSPLPSGDYWFRLEYTDPRGQRVGAQYLKAHFALKR